MKAIVILAAAAAMVTLGGCDRLRGGGGSTNTNTTTASNGSASATGNSAQSADAGGKPAEGGGGGAIPASSTGGPVQLDRTFLMGRWTDDDNCATAIEFTQDGRFITAQGTGGLWRLEGDRLTMTGQSTVTIRIEPVDQNTMTVINGDGSLGRSTRC